MNLRDAAGIVIKNVVKQKRNCDLLICISIAIDSAAEVAEGVKPGLYSYSPLHSRRYL